MRLPLREQGTLIVATRGCDTAPKHPLDSIERQLTAYLRYLTLVPADPREVGIEGAFFRPQPPTPGWKQSELGHLPLHWVSHIMHAYEVVGYRHPSTVTAGQAYNIYWRLAYGLHLLPEPRDNMIERLSEDRIANNTVVS